MVGIDRSPATPRRRRWGSAERCLSRWWQAGHLSPASASAPASARPQVTSTAPSRASSSRTSAAPVSSPRATPPRVSRATVRSAASPPRPMTPTVTGSERPPVAPTAPTRSTSAGRGPIPPGRSSPAGIPSVYQPGFAAQTAIPANSLGENDTSVQFVELGTDGRRARRPRPDHPRPGHPGERPDRHGHRVRRGSEQPGEHPEHRRRAVVAQPWSDYGAAEDPAWPFDRVTLATFGQVGRRSGAPRTSATAT